MSLPDRLIFVDIETTGLEPETDQMLELAVAIVERNTLQMVDAGTWVIQPFAGPASLEFNEAAQKMHEANGLLDEIRDGRGRAHFEVESDALRFLGTRLNHGESPMCGSSVHFDRSFIRLQMPALHTFFHYRNLDCSSLKNGVLFWGHKKDEWVSPPHKTHRALDDVQVSISEMAYYRQLLFASVPPSGNGGSAGVAPLRPADPWTAPFTTKKPAPPWTAPFTTKKLAPPTNTSWTA